MNKTSTRWYGIAAIFIVFFGVWALLHDRVFAPSAPAIISRETVAGRNAVHTLPDGTTVTLQGESTLTFPEEFRSMVREVGLEGEAFFEVAEDRKRPFEVKAGELTVKVPGTSFNIRAYGKENKVVITVVSGKVLVSLENPGAVEEKANPYLWQVVLVPGEQIVHKTGEKGFVKTGIYR